MQKKNVVLVTFLVAALATVGLAYGSFGHGTQPDLPVTSILNDTGVVTAGTNYQIQSDGAGSYLNGVASVGSVLQGSSGDWVLDTASSTTRTILIDLRQPVPNSGATAPFAWELLPARIISKCHQALAGSFPAMALNQTLSCPTAIAFQYGGNSYGLMMASGPNSINYAETNNPLVTCTSVDGSNHCNRWTVLPIRQPDGTIKNIARLRQPLPGNNNFAFLGDYYLSFSIELTNP